MGGPTGSPLYAYQAFVCYFWEMVEKPTCPLELSRLIVSYSDSQSVIRNPRIKGLNIPVGSLSDLQAVFLRD